MLHVWKQYYFFFLTVSTEQTYIHTQIMQRWLRFFFFFFEEMEKVGALLLQTSEWKICSDRHFSHIYIYIFMTSGSTKCSLMTIAIFLERGRGVSIWPQDLLTSKTYSFLKERGLFISTTLPRTDMEQSQIILTFIIGFLNCTSLYFSTCWCFYTRRPTLRQWSTMMSLNRV